MNYRRHGRKRQCHNVRFHPSLPVGLVENHDTFIQGTRSMDSSLNEEPPVQYVGQLSVCVCVCMRVPQTGKCRMSLFQQVIPVRKRSRCVHSLRHLFNTAVHNRFLINGCTICSILLLPASSPNARVTLNDRTNASTPNTVILYTSTGFSSNSDKKFK